MKHIPNQILLLLFLSFLPIVSTEAQEDIHLEEQTVDLFPLAIRAANDGDYQQAISYLSKYIDAGNTTCSAFWGRAECYYEVEDFDAALEDVDRALEKSEVVDKGALNLLKGRILLMQEKYDQAIGLLSISVYRESQNYEAYLFRGDAYFHSKQYRKAISDYSEVLNRNPENPSLKVHLYKFRGRAFENLGIINRAARDYAKVLTFDPQDHHTYLRKTNAHLQLHEYSKALKNLTNLIKNQNITNDSIKAVAFFQRATCQMYLKHNDAVEADLDTAFLYNSELPVDFLKGQNYFLAGQWDQAEDFFSKAAETGQNPSLAYMQRGWIRELQGDQNRAISDYSTSVRYDPNNYKAYYLRGHLKYRLEDPTYQNDLTRVLEAPSQPKPQDNIRPFALFILGKKVEAKNEMGKILTTFPNTETLYEGSAFFSLMEKTSQAMDLLKQAKRKGFKDWYRFYKDPNMEGIREDKHFEKFCNEAHIPLEDLILE